MIYVASDHAGFELKEKIKQYLDKLELEYIDLGANSTESVDYPFYAKALAEEVASSENARGILICGTGIGMSIAVNRFKKVRGALCCSVKMAKLARQHNDANVLVLGARSKTMKFKYKKIINTFLNTNFEGGRHIKRVELLDM